MNNKIFLEQMKNYYDSLKYFDIQNYYLILKLDKEYKAPLIHTNLSSINPNLFLLHPIEIFQILYMLELLYKNELIEAERNFIKDYTEKYLTLDTSNKNEDNINLNRLWGLSLPINLAYDPQFENLPCAKQIISQLDKQTKEIENGHGKYPTLTLKKGDNPNFELEPEINNINSLEKAGFTTLFLITSSVIATCLYIAYFIIGN